METLKAIWPSLITFFSSIILVICFWTWRFVQLLKDARKLGIKWNGKEYEKSNV